MLVRVVRMGWWLRLGRCWRLVGACADELGAEGCTATADRLWLIAQFPALLGGALQRQELVGDRLQAFLYIGVVCRLVCP